MTYIFRAALAASAALTFGACATSSGTSKAETSIMKPPVPVTVKAKPADKMDSIAEMESVKDTAMSSPVMSEADTPKSDMLEAAAPAEAESAETLLYGAMTKYELMRFTETVRENSLESLLESETPITVFAPNNDAFERAKIGEGTDIKAALKGLMIPGAFDIEALKSAVAENGSSLKMMSAAGTELTVYVMNGAVRLAGPGGLLVSITQADMIQSNGVMHQINTLPLPQE